MMRDGVAPALAIYRTAREYGTTAGAIQKRLAMRRKIRQQDAKPKGMMCLDCGTLPAERNGLCSTCEMATASPLA